MTDSAFLKSLDASTTAADREHAAAFYASMPPALRRLVDDAASISAATPDTIRASIGLIDHTSLKEGQVPMIGTESADEIRKVCAAAAGTGGAHTAAVCVYPNQIAVAREALAGSGVKLAVVNNFPHGDLGAAEAAADAAQSVAKGADEVDTVIDYAAQLAGDGEAVAEKLNAVGAAVHAGGAQLKTILKASVYPDYDSLYRAAVTAIECGADFVKTCTGKKPLPGYGTGTADASTLLTAATVMQAVADNRATHPDVGVKISGGVKTPVDCERMRHLVDNILGPEFFDPARFRFGASSLLANLAPAPAPSAGPAPASAAPRPALGGY